MLIAHSARILVAAHDAAARWQTLGAAFGGAEIIAVAGLTPSSHVFRRHASDRETVLRRSTSGGEWWHHWLAELWPR